MGSLARRAHRPYVSAMRTLTVLLALVMFAAPALAQTRKPAAPTPAAAKPAGGKQFGDFGDWKAATSTEAGQTVCYAISFASHSAPAVPGRDKVVLTVTERPSQRDTVAISVGYAYPGTNPVVAVQVDQTSLDFYPAGRSAFARDGHAVVAAFQRGKQVTVRAPGPRTGTVVDTFSLNGFSRAYEAVTKSCPAK